MRWTKKKNRLAMAMAAFFAGGTVLQSNCANIAYSLPICGTVLTFCTPTDQLNVLFPLLEIPDFNADPSCTIPLGCGGGDLFAPSLPDGFTPPGGTEPQDPADDSSGGGAGGGGGGGGI